MAAATGGPPSATANTACRSSCPGRPSEPGSGHIARACPYPCVPPVRVPRRGPRPGHPMLGIPTPGTLDPYPLALGRQGQGRPLRDPRRLGQLDPLSPTQQAEPAAIGPKPNVIRPLAVGVDELVPVLAHGGLGRARTTRTLPDTACCPTRPAPTTATADAQDEIGVLTLIIDQDMPVLAGGLDLEDPVHARGLRHPGLNRTGTIRCLPQIHPPALLESQLIQGRDRRCHPLGQLGRFRGRRSRAFPDFPSRPLALQHIHWIPPGPALDPLDTYLAGRSQVVITTHVPLPSIITGTRETGLGIPRQAVRLHVMSPRVAREARSATRRHPPRWQPWPAAT